MLHFRHQIILKINYCLTRAGLKKITSPTKTKKMNYKIKETALNQSVLLSLSLDGWKAFKLTREQALKFSFKDEQATFSELAQTYGAENIIEENMFYSGYAVVCSYPANILIRMHGKAKKTAPNNLCFAPQSINSAYLNGCLYKIVVNIGDIEQSGYFSYIWPLGCTPFEKLMDEKKATTLREKLVDASLKNKEVSISKDEKDILKKVFGSYFECFFKEI